MHSLRHDNHADLGILSAMVECVPVQKHALFAAALVGRDLMRGPWWLRALANSVRLLRGWTPTTTWFLFLERLGRGYASDIVSNFASHIVTGKDLSDRRSVGGLNQKEIDTTIMLLRNLLAGVEVHSLYRSILNPAPAAISRGLTLSEPEVLALLYGTPKGVQSETIKKMALWLEEKPFEDAPSPTPKVLESSDDDAECCIACEEPLEDGDLVYWDVNDTGHIHSTCCGPERESYVNADGEPLKDDEPIPEPFAWRAER